MKKAFSQWHQEYKANPGWYWLLFTAFSFFLLPEYVSPFILFAGFIVFKRQWTRERRYAKVGNVGKIELALMTYMLASTLWSPTKLDTLGCAGLWWGMFLIQVMIYNLARTKQRIRKVIQVIVASAAMNGLIGLLQIITYILSANLLINERLVLVTPFYRNLDTIVYEALPFSISTKMWAERASGFFSNPNLLATFMLVAFPLAAYLLLTAETKKQTGWSYAALVLISAGMGSTMTRAGCYVMVAEWIVLFILFAKRRSKRMLSCAVPVFGFAVPALLIRYGVISIYAYLEKLASNEDYVLSEAEVWVLDGAEAMASSETHWNIWKSMIDYLLHHAKAFIIGTGFGCEETSNILSACYALNKPHAHNFVIELWTELGIIGIALIILILVYAIGKVLEIDSTEFETLALVVCIVLSLVAFLVFGLSDYIFNSPKQIILFMILLGLIQAISYSYEKELIHNASDVGHMAMKEVTNILHQ